MLMGTLSVGFTLHGENLCSSAPKQMANFGSKVGKMRSLVCPGGCLPFPVSPFGSATLILQSINTINEEY